MARHESPDGEWLDQEAGPLVRLYGVTRGRTHGEAVGLDLLSVVVTEAHPPSDARLGPEHLAILRLCRRPRAVVEIGADLDLPIGVLRVLLSDLAAYQLITIRLPNQAALRPDALLLEELLHGLHNL
ncbi:DUF742 domain-containing protein [Actinocatenispora rupis]|uniref:DUF742 domain-containing protein n=1 Tax=Actinocatenispora rupis TaxID=519421 RepID=A0A8J3J722_9ACTN|nr:DUF742 domain-containing protein [Actinocatenispora rupis]GID15308.1 hypothetical protein Aru02nite_61970 [Actinocatenispora rupis]